MADPIDFTLIDEHEKTSIPATIVGSHVRLPPDAVAKALGWKLEKRGLCKGSRCVSVADFDGLVTDAGVDLTMLSRALGRPLAIDLDHRAAALAAPAADRRASMVSLEAPDFTLPDLEGNLHSLSQHRGKKILLVAHASW